MVNWKITKRPTVRHKFIRKKIAEHQDKIANPSKHIQNPNNSGNGVRVDQGNPNNSQASQQVDHDVVRSNGQVIGRDGKPIDGPIKENAEQTHIPLDEYINWNNWNSPE